MCSTNTVRPPPALSYTVLLLYDTHTSDQCHNTKKLDKKDLSSVCPTIDCHQTFFVLSTTIVPIAAQ